MGGRVWTHTLPADRVVYEEERRRAAALLGTPEYGPALPGGQADVPDAWFRRSRRRPSKEWRPRRHEPSCQSWGVPPPARTLPLACPSAEQRFSKPPGRGLRSLRRVDE